MQAERRSRFIMDPAAAAVVAALCWWRPLPPAAVYRNLIEETTASRKINLF